MYYASQYPCEALIVVMPFRIKLHYNVQWYIDFSVKSIDIALVSISTMMTSRLEMMLSYFISTQSFCSRTRRNGLSN